jgi:transposase
VPSCSSSSPEEPLDVFDLGTLRRLSPPTLGTRASGHAEGLSWTARAGPVATLTGTCQLSRRDAELFLTEVMGIDIRLGTVSATGKIVSEAMAPIHEQASAALRKQKVAGVDETMHKRAGERGTTWVGTSPQIAVFLAGVRRARDVFFKLFGENFGGVINTDRYVVYDVIPPARRQLCWAHLKRAFKALLDEGGDAARVGRRLLDNTKNVLKAVRERRAGRMPVEDFARTIDASKSEMRWLLADNRHLTGLRTILEAFVLTPESVWLFTTRDDVDATNSMAERDLRRFVIWRKTSSVTQHRPCYPRQGPERLPFFARMSSRRRLLFVATS